MKAREERKSVVIEEMTDTQERADTHARLRRTRTE